MEDCTEGNTCNGDINSDNLIDVLDIILLVNLILDEEYYVPYFDINSDGDINVVDIIIIVNCIVNE